MKLMSCFLSWSSHVGTFWYAHLIVWDVWKKYSMEVFKWDLVWQQTWFCDLGIAGDSSFCVPSGSKYGGRYQVLENWCSSWNANALGSKRGYNVPDGISEPKNPRTFYILVLPLLDGQFRASWQGTVVNELELCIESGWFSCCIHAFLAYFL